MANDSTKWIPASDECHSTVIEELTITENGTYTAPDGMGYSPVTVDVAAEPGADVVFFDYDGSRAATYSKADFLALDAMPENPTHEGLVAQGWNWSLSDAQDYVEKYGVLNVGQTYITESGNTEIDITLTAPDLSPYLKYALDGTMVIDWGDNTTPDTVTGSSTETTQYQQHVYAAAGDYTISLAVTGEMEFAISSEATNYDRGVLVDQAAPTHSQKYSDDITAIRLGDNVTLGEQAVRECISMRTITLPNGLTSIGESAFTDCLSLVSLTIPDGVTSAAPAMCDTCAGMTTLSLPNGITEIEDDAFLSCYTLESVTLPDSVTRLGEDAFEECHALRSIVIPDGVTEIGGWAFDQCHNLESVTIPDSVTAIGESAFSFCHALTSVVIPDGVTTIEASTFEECNILRSVVIPDSVTSIGEKAFYNCLALSDLTIPEGVTEIGVSAFYRCFCLTGLTIPDGVTEINEEVFSTCWSLTTIDIPAGVTSIGANAFSSDQGLVAVTIPEGVTSIGNSSFSNCSALTSLTIPATVTSIGKGAFSNCHSMEEYHFLPTTPPPLGDGFVFGNIPADCIIYVPYSADHSVLTAYKSASLWSNLASRIQEESQ